MTVIKGVDVSVYQPTYDASGYGFVFVKATEGHTWTSPVQGKQAATARAAGAVVGFYHFLWPGHVAEQAAYFVQRCDSVPGDILACDWETTSDGTAATCAEKDAFLAEVKRLRPKGRVVLYCNTDFWLHRDTTSRCGDGLWIADITTAGQPRITHPWTFHQYSSADGLDRDVADFPSHEALRTWATALLP
ncbi:glycoside hydrolase family 25 protein [Streptomyces yaizuensis]|uniref:Muramidase n=1 Tax=Streptomyces yaizuensis TaxID=2989713 RepID=A0ABQ5NR56_9ACTN|nr:glycoside hydrolase family 25 protein [Streptomyces sp. YSPA8]GLF92861.1 muramidase [Streptomyces sp. YSPA8]